MYFPYLILVGLILNLEFSVYGAVRLSVLNDVMMSSLQSNTIVAAILWRKTG